MDGKQRLLSRLIEIRQELFRITRLPEFDKKFSKYKYDLRKLTAEVVHRTNNIVGEQQFVNQNFKSKFRQESLLGLSFGNNKKDFFEILDNLDNLIHAVNLDKNPNFTYNFNTNLMNPSPSRFAIPIYLITIISVLIFHILKIPILFSVFIFVSSSLLISLVCLFELKNNGHFKDSDFFQHLTQVLKWIISFGKSQL